jgi:anaerobic selenocysteine-containing dehydrogenase
VDNSAGFNSRFATTTSSGSSGWEDFPFNRGMLCPKGVKRYLQSNHPDRLLDPLLRTDAGFVKANWEDAMAFTARRIREIQEHYGKDSVAVYGGASLTTEKSYLMASLQGWRSEPDTLITTAGSAWFRRELRTNWLSMWIAV